MVAWDDPGSHKVAPDAHVGTSVGVGRKETFGIWVCILEEFTNYCAFVKGLGFVFKCWDKSARVEF